MNKINITLADDQITDHFKLREFICSDGKTAIITPDFLLFVFLLEKLRLWYRRPINITSGYRTPAHNAKVGGSKNSLHLIGQAIDFRFPSDYAGADPDRRAQIERNIKDKWWELCKSAGVYPAMGLYKTHIHLGISREHSFFKDWRV